MIRRNKWSIIKFILILALTLYTILYIKSLVLINRDTTNIDSNLPQVYVGHQEAIHSDDIGHGDRNHKYAGNLSNSDLGFDSHELGQKVTPRFGKKHLPSSVPFKKKDLIFNRIDIKKKRLDDELKILNPVIDGWGDLGSGVDIKDEEESKLVEKEFKKGAYNVYVSDRMSPNRSLKRVSAEECFSIKYDEDELPTVSVIIIFTDEIFSALIRTIWSVINRTPKKLLKEIILVDDASERPHLKQTLEDYIDYYLNSLPRYHASDRHEDKERDGPLVKLARLPERRGLIKARLKGARMAVGDVLLFLDSHCEVTELWVEPLLQRIKENRQVFICPVIDIINDKNLEYNPVDPYLFQLGGFDWSGHFTWINRKHDDIKSNPTGVAKTPTMAGGLFAVDRKYFFEIGSYDEDMKIWGGENLEVSFRVWQCGGRVEIHPCSHVGHIFRDYHPYSFKGIDSHGFNTVRTVHVWMDQYARYFFMSRPDLKEMDPGDLTKRLEFRKNLNCSNFNWYLKNVYDNRKYIYDENVKAYGYLKNPSTDLCLDTLNRPEVGGSPAALYNCEDLQHPAKSLTNQLFSLSNSNQIRREEGCLVMDPEPKQGKKQKKRKKKTKKSKLRNKLKSDGNSNEDEDTTEDVSDGRGGTKRKVHMFNCLEAGYDSHSSSSHVNEDDFKKQTWRYVKVKDETDPQLYMVINEHSNLCLTAEDSQSQSDLFATQCDDKDPEQYWTFQKHVDPSLS